MNLGNRTPHWLNDMFAEDFASEMMNATRKNRENAERAAEHKEKVRNMHENARRATPDSDGTIVMTAGPDGVFRA